MEEEDKLRQEFENLSKFNWGAFIYFPVYIIVEKMYIHLLALLTTFIWPIYLIYIIIFGFKANKLALNNRTKKFGELSEKEMDKFFIEQALWRKIGLGYLIITLIGISLVFILALALPSLFFLSI